MEKKPFRLEARRFCDLQKDNNNGLEGTGPPDHGTRQSHQHNPTTTENDYQEFVSMQRVDTQPNKPIVTPPEERWSDSYLVDNLKQHLALVQLSKSKTNTDLLNTPNDNFNSNFCLISNRHYINQAFHYLKIGVLSPIPEFLISLSDLSPKLVKELAILDKKTREFVLKQAVGRIFEDLNSKLYHNSISRVLNVRSVQ